MYTKVKDLYKHDDIKKLYNTEVLIGGWVRTLRNNKNFAFVEINDGTFFKSIQVIVDKELENYEEIIKQNVGACLTIKGLLVESKGSEQAFEIKATEIIVEGESTSDYPLQKKRHGFEYLRTISHLRPRTNTFLAVFRVRSLMSFAIHKFFNERDYVYAHTPLITGSDGEGAGEMFRVTTLDQSYNKTDENGEIDFKEDFFGKLAGLTVTGQLNAEAFAAAFRNVYTFGPTFRAENSNTTRHAAEFWMMEPEICFADLKDVMDLAEDMMKYVIKYVLENAEEEMKFFDSFIQKGLLERLNSIVSSEFVRITYTEAVDILLKSGKEFEYKVEWGVELQTEHEKYLTDEVYKKPVFVTDYPKDVKAFYMRLNDDGKTVGAMDLLVPGIGELMGGSIREERYDVLVEKMKDMNLNLEDYYWYLDLRKYGTVKHGGFGLGFERCVMYVTGMSNIRDVIPFARTSGNLDF